MGADVMLYAEAQVSPERLKKCDAFFQKFGMIGDPNRAGHVLYEVDSPFEWDGTRLPPRIEVYSLSRYFSPWNSRGHWPQIHVGIRVLQACFPEAKVFYGSDENYSGAEVDEDLIAAHWGAWYKFLAERNLDPKKTVWATDEANVTYFSKVNRLTES